MSNASKTEKYDREARKYWDIFYKHHQDRFFKDRHYLGKEWGCYFSGEGKRVILEVGCGAGNTVFPLIATYPSIFVHACDFSPRAVDLIKMHKEFTETQIRAFVCDLTADDLSKQISPSSIDIVTMIFVLSAVSPEKMALILQNIKNVLKPNGYVLFRDYATGDLTQERFTYKDQKLSENFYVRGDGTRVFYFSNEFLRSVFEENGFVSKENELCCKQVENRSREIVMNRRWIQAVFCSVNDARPTSTQELVCKVNERSPAKFELEVKNNTSKEVEEDFEFDMSDGLAVEMFNTFPTCEVIEVPLSGCNFKISVLSKEYQHTCKLTGLMLWESARLMASIISLNPNIVSGKRVLEVGSGCSGICSMVSSIRSAKLVISTDGDPMSLELLTKNVNSNINPPTLAKIFTKRLVWGNREDIESIKQINSDGFEVIIGTDVTYVSEAIAPLFYTARELISRVSDDSIPGLIICYTVRRVDQPYILSIASRHDFLLVDQWPSSRGIINSWFLHNSLVDHIPNSAIHIMYFQTEPDKFLSP